MVENRGENRVKYPWINGWKFTSYSLSTNHFSRRVKGRIFVHHIPNFHHRRFHRKHPRKTLAVNAFWRVFHKFTAPTIDDDKECCFLSNKRKDDVTYEDFM